MRKGAAMRFISELLIRKNTTFVISFVILIIFNLNSFSSSNFGTTTGEFLKINPEAAQAGMGEAATAAPDGTSAIIYNPAGLAVLDRNELSVTQINWFISGLSMYHAAYAMSLGQGLSLGTSLFWLDFGTFDSTGGVMPSVSARDGLLSAVISKSLTRQLHVGAGIKALYENVLNETTAGLSFDAGISYAIIDKKLYAGFVMKNTGALFGVNDMLPLEACGGLSFRNYDGSFNNFTLNLDVSKIIITDNFYAALGAEYWLFRTVALRLGVKYDNALESQGFTLSDLTSLTMIDGGVGINLGGLGAFDYAFTPMGELGAVHRFTLKVKFGESLYEQYLAEMNAQFVPKAIEVPKVNVEQGQIKSVSFKPNVPEEKVKEWTLAIKTSDGRIVRTFSGVGEVPKTLTWDGTNAIGEISKADANYVFDFKAKNFEGQIIKTVGQIIQPKEYEFFVPEDKPFVPLKGEEMLVAPVTLLVSSDRDERKQVPFVMVNKKIKNVKSWEFAVYDKAGQLLKKFSGLGVIPGYLVWDGRDSIGVEVTDLKTCRYELVVNGTDGRQAKIREKEVVRDPFIIASKTKKLSLARKIYFEKGSVAIRQEMRERLDEIAREIEGQKNVQVYIQGHSSGEGDDDGNLNLSQERAKNVLRFFVEKYRISPLTITTVGYGSSVPQADNVNEEARRRNRRVEVIIMGEKTE